MFITAVCVIFLIKSLLFCLRDDPLRVFPRQNHVISIFIKTMSHHLLVQVGYCDWLISACINIDPQDLCLLFIDRQPYLH